MSQSVIMPKNKIKKIMITKSSFLEGFETPNIIYKKNAKFHIKFLVEYSLIRFVSHFINRRKCSGKDSIYLNVCRN